MKIELTTEQIKSLENLLIGIGEVREYCEGDPEFFDDEDVAVLNSIVHS